MPADYARRNGALGTVIDDKLRGSKTFIYSFIYIYLINSLCRINLGTKGNVAPARVFSGAKFPKMNCQGNLGNLGFFLGNLLTTLVCFKLSAAGGRRLKGLPCAFPRLCRHSASPCARHSTFSRGTLGSICTYCCSKPKRLLFHTYPKSAVPNRKYRYM